MTVENRRGQKIMFSCKLTKLEVRVVLPTQYFYRKVYKNTKEKQKWLSDSQKQQVQKPENLEKRTMSSSDTGGSVLQLWAGKSSLQARALSKMSLCLDTNFKPGTLCSTYLQSWHTFQIFGSHNILPNFLILSGDKRSIIEVKNKHLTDDQIPSPASGSVIFQTNCGNQTRSKERLWGVDKPALKRHTAGLARTLTPIPVIDWYCFLLLLKAFMAEQNLQRCFWETQVHLLPRQLTFWLKATFLPTNICEYWFCKSWAAGPNLIM